MIWTFADTRGDYIPGFPSASDSLAHPDDFDIRRAPRTLAVPQGRPTINLDKERKTIVMKCGEHCPDWDSLRRAVPIFARDFGQEAIEWLEVLVSQEIMQSPEEGSELHRLGFTRIEEANPTTGLFKFRKKVRFRKKQEKK